MLQFSQIKGFIFDVDDTLLDNGSRPDITKGLHTRSRLRAAHEIGNEENDFGLQNLTEIQNVNAFLHAPSHSLRAAVTEILRITDPENKRDSAKTADLLEKIIMRKDLVHEDVLRAEGREVEGASKFLHALANNGFKGKLALASTAIRRDIDIILEKLNVTDLFLDNNIVSLERIDPTKTKPDPDPFNKAFTSLGLSDEDRPFVVAFEDDPRGIQSAKGAGLFVCAVTTRFDKGSPELKAADMVADTYDDFGKFLGVPSY